MREIEDLLGPALDCDLHHYTGVGLRDFTLIDPTGVLSRVGHVIPDR